MSDEMEVKVKPTFDCEVIPLETGGGIVIISELDLEIDNPQQDHFDAITVGLKEHFRESADGISQWL